MSGVGQDSKPERESQVRAAQVQLDEALGRAEKAVLSLFSRIESVTKQIPPAAQEVAAGKPSDLVVLAAWINDKAERIDGLAKSIVNTMGRVEL